MAIELSSLKPTTEAEKIVNQLNQIISNLDRSKYPSQIRHLTDLVKLHTEGTVSSDHLKHKAIVELKTINDFPTLRKMQTISGPIIIKKVVEEMVLSAAIDEADWKKAKKLIDEGVRNQKNRNAELAGAAMDGRTDIMNILIQSGAEFSIIGISQAIVNALENGFWEIAEDLLDSVEIMPYSLLALALRFAARTGDLENVVKLLKKENQSCPLQPDMIIAAINAARNHFKTASYLQLVLEERSEKVNPAAQPSS